MVREAAKFAEKEHNVVENVTGSSVGRKLAVVVVYFDFWGSSNFIRCIRAVMCLLCYTVPFSIVRRV